MTAFQRGSWIAAVESRRRASTGLMWLARHRDRLYTLTLGSAHFFVVFGFDRDGAKENAPISDAEVDAMRLVAWGESPVVEHRGGSMMPPEKVNDLVYRRPVDPSLSMAQRAAAAIKVDGWSYGSDAEYERVARVVLAEVAEWLRQEPTEQEVEAVHGDHRGRLRNYGSKLARLKVYRLTLAEELDPTELPLVEHTEAGG